MNDRANSLDVLSVDVEEYFHATTFESIIPRSEWEDRAGRSARSLDRLLQLLDDWNVHATFFILGWFAERNREQVRAIHEGGHEVASHGYDHQLIYAMTPDSFREDIRRAKGLIEDVAGVPVKGYRAPTFSIVSRTAWAVPILVEEGYEYDSSVFPIHHDRYGIPDFPRHPVRIETESGSLVEFPLTTVRLGPFNFPVSGGGYLRLLPFPFIRRAIARVRRRGRLVNLYVHPWEIDSRLPAVKMPLLKRWRHYKGIRQVESRLAHLVADGDFKPFREILPRIDLPVWSFPASGESEGAGSDSP